VANHANIYSVPRASFFDLPATAGAEPYRIFLSIPAGSPPAEGWPLLVLTDGNATFPFAAACLATQAPYPAATNTGWGVVVAIGYPLDEAYDGVRRSWDLSPPPGNSYPPFTTDGPPVRTGGAECFLAFIQNVLLPWIQEKVPVNNGRKTLFGHSFGGLFTLYSLFERPGLFDNWIAASPAIYWEEAVILQNERRRRNVPDGAAFLHLSAGEYEGDELAPFQQKNEDADTRMEHKKETRTVLLAREMAQRLESGPDGLRARFELYAGETHMSVLAVAVSRAVGIAFAIRA
jgi:predicted alpha/beta superfamily hydrolase